MSNCDKRLLGFSARLIGGGTGGGPLASRSLFSSPERLGGGGDGGPIVAESLGDRPASSTGVCGLLGILNVRGEEAIGVPGALIGSMLSGPFSTPGATLVALPFGGDCGGSIRTAGGGFNGRGLGGGFGA